MAFALSIPAPEPTLIAQAKRVGGRVAVVKSEAVAACTRASLIRRDSVPLDAASFHPLFPGATDRSGSNARNIRTL
jgi:hypothetical protein